MDKIYAKQGVENDVILDVLDFRQAFWTGLCLELADEENLEQDY